MSESLDVNGEAPNLSGQILEELLSTEMWYEGKLEEPANVIYLKVNGSWFRHYFDCGIIFWRTDDRAPESYEMEELDSYFKVVDLAVKFGFKGLRIRSYEACPLENGSETIFTFSNDCSIIFSCIDDVTSYRT